MTTTKKTEPVTKPAIPSSLDAPGAEAEATFPPSAELGEQLERLEEAQAEIDRRKAEELAHLRELQDRD
jgi:hypothetical protein